MIVKHLRIKNTNSFSRLVQYLARGAEKSRGDEEPFRVLHNLRYTDSLEAIAEQFKANDNYRKKRSKGKGVVLYHEVMSFSPESGSVPMAVLQDLAEEYIRLRGDKALCLAVPHVETNHAHVHLLFSGTEYKSSKTLRIDNAAWKKLHQDIEAYQQKHYPELSDSLVYTNTRDRAPRRQQQEDQRSRGQRRRALEDRVGKGRTQKAYAAELVQDCCRHARTLSDFYAGLSEAGVEHYTYRGKRAGIRVGGRKFRWKTLGVTLQPLIEIEERMHDLDAIRASQNRRRTPQSQKVRSGEAESRRAPESEYERRMQQLRQIEEERDLRRGDLDRDRRQ